MKIYIKASNEKGCIAELKGTLEVYFSDESFYKDYGHCRKKVNELESEIEQLLEKWFPNYVEITNK